MDRLDSNGWACFLRSMYSEGHVTTEVTWPGGVRCTVKPGKYPFFKHFLIQHYSSGPRIWCLSLQFDIVTKPIWWASIVCTFRFDNWGDWLPRQQSLKIAAIAHTWGKPYFKWQRQYTNLVWVTRYTIFTTQLVVVICTQRSHDHVRQYPWWNPQNVHFSNLFEGNFWYQANTIGIMK